MFTGKSVFITGGAKGIGKAIARKSAEEGATRIGICDINEASAKATAKEIPGGIALVLDVAKENDFTAALDSFGHIDVFVGNAGVMGKRSLGLEETSNENFDWVMGINFHHNRYAAKALLRRSQPPSKFIITASAAGLLMQPGSFSYTISKQAAVTLAEILYVHHPNLEVYCICPEYVDTGLINCLVDDKDDIAKLDLLKPDAVALSLMEAIQKKEFLVLPHTDVQKNMEFKAKLRSKWLHAMRAHVRKNGPFGFSGVGAKSKSKL